MTRAIADLFFTYYNANIIRFVDSCFWMYKILTYITYLKQKKKTLHEIEPI